jgi:general secretion pathway protein F
MPVFKYRGYGAGGGKAAGVVEAEGLRDAVLKVKALGLHPKDVREQTEGRRFGLRRDADAGRLALVTRQLSVLLCSDVPLVEALRALGEESGGRWRSVLLGIRERVTEGASLSRAMSDYGGVFPEYYRSMVTAGERSGTLDGVLESLSDFLEGQTAIKEKVKAAMLYPMFMLCVGGVVLAFLFVFVVPKIVVIFEDTKTALPLATAVLIGLSNFFVDYWWLMLTGLAALAFGGRRLAKRHKRLIDRGLMRVFEGLYLSRFSMTLSFLLDGGLPMLKALELAGRTSGNSHLSGMVKDASVMVSEGTSLSSSLTGLPPVLLELISTGEKSGRLTEVLKRAAASYEAAFDRKVQKALTLLEPAMILLMGIVVGYIVFAVLLPLFQLNQLIK